MPQSSPQPSPLPSHFRKLSPSERLQVLQESCAKRGTALSPEELLFSQTEGDWFDLSGVLVENAVGYSRIPLGIVPELLVNGRAYSVPLATEEPSVIAAVTYAGRILSSSGGLRAQGAPSLTKGQIFFALEESELGQPWEEVLGSCYPSMEELMAPHLSSMTRRGGGLQGWEWRVNQEALVLEVGFWIDSQDAMGANLVNTLAEAAAPVLEQQLGREKIMAILSNTGTKRLAKAQFSLPFSRLKMADKDPAARARKIVKASQIAWSVPDRAVTHNKGIMNGVSALALATGNDTRALEAAVHAYAASSGQYRALSRYSINEDVLMGEITLPLPLAAVGGAINYHPGFSAARKYLGSPGAQELTALGAAVGLAQNFAAVLALTGPGIQKGHMGLHAGRLAYQAGARGEEIPQLVKKIQEKGVFRLEESQVLLEELKNKVSE